MASLRSEHFCKTFALLCLFVCLFVLPPPPLPRSSTHWKLRLFTLKAMRKFDAEAEKRLIDGHEKFRFLTLLPKAVNVWFETMRDEFANNREKAVGELFLGLDVQELY